MSCGTHKRARMRSVVTSPWSSRISRPPRIAPLGLRVELIVREERGRGEASISCLFLRQHLSQDTVVVDGGPFPWSSNSDRGK